MAQKFLTNFTPPGTSDLYKFRAGALFYGTTSNSTTAMTVSIPGVTEYYTGLTLILKMGAQAASGCTLNVNSLGAKAMKYGADSVGTYFTSGATYLFVYDGTDFKAVHSYNSNTTYSAEKGITLSSGKFGHTNSITAKTTYNQSTASPGYGGTFKITEPKYDAYGHITGVQVATITMPSAYTHPTSSGNKHIPSGGSSGQILRWSADGTAAWGADTNTAHSHSAGVGLTGSGSAGTSGTYTYKVNLVDETASANAASYTAGGASKFYAVQLDKNNKLGVYVPWTDNNTTYDSMSISEGTTGTATTNRVLTAANLKAIIAGSAAASATKWATARNINGMTIQGDANRVNYGTCSTAGTTAAKVVDCTGFALITGAEITVKFTTANTAANPTLNVNGTGAKAIHYRGSAISASYLAKDRTYTFRYNGSQYELVGDINTNTTYSNATTSTAGLMSKEDKAKLDAITDSADAVSFSRSLTSGTKVGTITINGTGTDLYAPTNTDTKNTAGSTDTSNKIYLIGATSQGANPQTYSHDTVYVDNNGKLVSNSYILGDTTTFFKTGFKSSKNYTFPKETSKTYYVVLKKASSFEEQKFMFKTVGNNTQFITLATINARPYMGATIHGKTLKYNSSEISKIAVYKNTTTTFQHDIVLAIKTNSTTTTTLYVTSDGDFDLNSECISTTAPTGVVEASFSPNDIDRLFTTSPIYAGGGFIGNLSGNASTATKLATARTISLTGSVTGSGTFDGSGNLSIATTTNHNHNLVLDSGNSTNTTFAYSKSGLNYSEYTWLAGWNGYELRAVNKAQFAQASHTHNYAGSSSAGGSATSAVKLDTATAGSATQPVYFSGGKPVAITGAISNSTTGNAATATKATQDSDGNQINTTYVKKSGSAMNDLNALTATTSTTINITPNVNAVASSPFARDLWHDHLAFLAGGHTISGHQVTTNGSTWTDSTLDLTPLFMQKESTTVTILGTTELARRFTIQCHNIGYSDISWYEIGVGYSSPFSQFEVCIETSSDNSNWSQVHKSTIIQISKPVFLKGSSLGGNKYLRFTFTKTTNTTTGTVLISCLKAYTARKADQGLGIEYECPYDWNSSRDIYPHSDNSRSLGLSNKRWKNVYATTFTGTLSGNAATATKLATARTIRTNLGSTSTASFDGSTNITPGVTGTLPVANGGTGATTFTSGAALIGNGTGAVSTRSITNMTGVGYINYNTNLMTTNTLAYWNGAYNSSGTSNLAYCTKGAFGTAAIKGVDTTATSGSGNLITSGAMYTALAGKAPSSHTHNYAGSSSAGGSANSAVKLDTATAGSSTQPVYFSGGKPVAITGAISNSTTGNAATATKLATARTISLTGSVTGSGSFDGSGNLSIATTTNHTHDSSYVKKSGDTMTGNLIIDSSSPYFRTTGTNGSIGLYVSTNRGIYDFANSKWMLAIDQASTKVYSEYPIYGAVWNDYAEFRICNEEFKPGQVVLENGDDTLSIASQRLQRGCSIVSDTFGFAIGETGEAKCPIAVSGRVLAYGYESREEFKKHIGWPVCSGPNGTVSIMTEEEEEKYPSRIIGTISAVPDYETWGTGNVEVNNRIWIKVK